MRLRTEMQGAWVHARGYCVDENDVDYTQALDIVRDCAAAHALMQAIDEIGTHGIQDADEIANRADEILREWGYAND